MNKIPCNKLINHSYEEISVSETRRQILEQSRERHGGQRKRSEITIPIAKSETEKNGLSKGGQTRVNSITGGVKQNTEESRQRNSPLNGAHKVPSQKIPNGDKVVAIKVY